MRVITSSLLFMLMFASSQIALSQDLETNDFEISRIAWKNRLPDKYVSDPFRRALSSAGKLGVPDGEKFGGMNVRRKSNDEIHIYVVNSEQVIRDQQICPNSIQQANETSKCQLWKSTLSNCALLAPKTIVCGHGFLIRVANFFLWFERGLDVRAAFHGRGNKNGVPADELFAELKLIAKERIESLKIIDEKFLGAVSTEEGRNNSIKKFDELLRVAHSIFGFVIFHEMGHIANRDHIVQPKFWPKSADTDSFDAFCSPPSAFEVGADDFAFGQMSKYFAPLDGATLRLFFLYEFILRLQNSCDTVAISDSSCSFHLIDLPWFQSIFARELATHLHPQDAMRFLSVGAWEERNFSQLRLVPQDKSVTLIRSTLDTLFCKGPRQ